MSLSVSENGHYLLTAGHNAVKVWDYNMKLDVKSQVCMCGYNCDGDQQCVPDETEVPKSCKNCACV